METSIRQLWLSADGLSQLNLLSVNRIKASLSFPKVRMQGRHGPAIFNKS